MLSRVKVSFESVTRDDREAVLSMLRGAPELAHVNIEPTFDRWLREGLFIKAVDADNRIVGVIHARQLEDSYWLEGIAVSNDIRRKGVGRQLALHVIELTGGRVFRVMASERNVPSNALALSLGFKEVDRVYFSDGASYSAPELASRLGLSQGGADDLPGPGFVDSWTWRPIALYRGRTFRGSGVVVLETDPPFFAAGDAEGYRRFSRQRGSYSEAFIVYELRKP